MIDRDKMIRLLGHSQLPAEEAEGFGDKLETYQLPRTKLKSTGVEGKQKKVASRGKKKQKEKIT